MSPHERERVLSVVGIAGGGPIATSFGYDTTGLTAERGSERHFLLFWLATQRGALVAPNSALSRSSSATGLKFSFRDFTPHECMDGRHTLRPADLRLRSAGPLVVALLGLHERSP